MVAASCLAALLVFAQPPRRIDDSTLRNAGKRTDEWLSYGLDQAETRYSLAKQINAGNVSRLGLAWSYTLGNGGGGQEATPLLWNGTLYGITNWSIVFAVDARTGQERWRWDPQVNQTATRPKVCCGVVNRGLAIYQGKVLAPVLDGRLVALDALKGTVVWQAQVSTVDEGYTLTMAPRVAKGKVIIGVAGAEYPNRGYFDAYEANTGKKLWRFYTVPGDPSKPYESEALKRAAATWSGDFWKLGGGGSVWDAMAYDADADLFYVATGNGGPWPQELRFSKGMDNLYICSILAVKPDTGELKWYFQSVPGDSWDFDAVQQMTLADITINGRKRKVLLQAQKNGFFYVLDRITGEFISGDPFATVSWAKGLDPKTGRPVESPGSHYGAVPMTIVPSPGGGHNWAPQAYNPNTGLIYIPTTLSSAWIFSVDPQFVYKPGHMNMGLGGRGGFGGVGQAPTAAPPGHTGAETPPPAAKGTLPPAPTIGPLLAPGEKPGCLVAWDPVARKERWRTPGGGSFWGGVVTTAGNLVFQVVNDGRLLAYSADKGKQLLEIQTGITSGLGPPITYELDGKQYVTLMGGMGSSIPPVYAEPDPSQANAPPPPGPKMLTFVLDGKAPLPTPVAKP